MKNNIIFRKFNSLRLVIQLVQIGIKLFLLGVLNARLSSASDISHTSASGTTVFPRYITVQILRIHDFAGFLRYNMEYTSQILWKNLQRLPLEEE